MVNWYLIEGVETGDQYLVVIEDNCLRVYAPGYYSLPGGSGWGLSYVPSAGHRFRRGWIGHFQAIEFVSRREHAERRKRRRRARNQRFAARMNRA